MADLETRINLLRSGDYHDFIITCRGIDFKVHRNMICPPSSYFQKLCNSNYKAGYFVTMLIAWAYRYRAGRH